jgi:hypothetical protein
VRGSLWWGRAVIENGSISQVRPEDKMAANLQMATLLFYQGAQSGSGTPWSQWKSTGHSSSSPDTKKGSF